MIISDSKDVGREILYSVELVKKRKPAENTSPITKSKYFAVLCGIIGGTLEITIGQIKESN